MKILFSNKANKTSHEFVANDTDTLACVQGPEPERGWITQDQEALVGPEERLMDGDAFVARWQGGCRSTTAGHGGKAYLETLGAGGAG